MPVKYNEDGDQVIVMSKKASVDKGDEEQAVEKTTAAVMSSSGAVVGADAIAAVAAAAKAAGAAAAADEDDDDGIEDEEKHNVFEFMSADILAKPFNFVSGSTSRNRFNPFRKKKSGLLNVLAKQATRSRLVGKNGIVNTMSATDGKTHHFFKDFFITLLDLSWRWVFCLFAAGFLSSWFLFACVWYLTMLQHGDFDEANRAPNSTHVPCVQTINDFTSCFLFSIETQHTIGYGTRQAHSEKRDFISRTGNTGQQT